MRLILYCCALVSALAAFPAGGSAQTPSCPALSVESKFKNRSPWQYTDGLCPDAQVTFTAILTGVDPAERPQFNWTVSAGAIVSGQGSPIITVSMKGADELAVTATVEVTKVQGLAPGCEARASATVGSAVCCLPPCPAVSIQCPTEVVKAGKPLTFSANVSGGDPELEITYNWSVSAGVIVSGQGTPTITVDTTRLAGNSVTATLELGGLPPECDRTESCTPPVAEHSAPGVDGGKVSLVRRRLWSPALGFCGLSGN